MIFIILGFLIGFIIGLCDDGFFLGILSSILGLIIGFIVWLFVGGIIVEPVRSREVFKEEALAATVVKHEVHDILYAMMVAIIDKSCKFFVRAKPRVNVVVVCDGISVVTPPGHIVCQDGSCPDSRYAKVFQIVEMVVDASYIASMTTERFVSPNEGVSESHSAIVVRIPIRKTVRHEQIDHV